MVNFKVVRTFHLQNIETGSMTPYMLNGVYPDSDLKLGNLDNYCNNNNIKEKLNYLETGGWIKVCKPENIHEELKNMLLNRAR